MSGTKCTFVFVLDAKLKLSFSWFLFSHSSYGWSSNFSLKSSFISLRTPDLLFSPQIQEGKKSADRDACNLQAEPHKPSCTMGSWASNTLGTEPGPWPSVPRFESQRLQQQWNQPLKCLLLPSQVGTVGVTKVMCQTLLLSELKTAGGEGIFRDDSTWKKNVWKQPLPLHFVLLLGDPLLKKR